MLLCALVGAASLRAHPEIESALSRLNPLIEASPDNAELYLDRGELYARHEDWVQAEANYLRAAELAPNLPRLDRYRGALALKSGDERGALAHFDRALEREPRDAEAYILRSRTRTVLQDRPGALADLNTALALIENPRPELFLERAALMPTAAAAVASLDAAIAQIGSAHTLQLRALELEETSGRTDAAVLRAERLAAQSERPDLWLKRAGDILVRAGRTVDARPRYSAALRAVHALPDWLRTAPETSRVSGELSELLNARSSPSS